MAEPKATVGVAKCPKTGKLYGVRINIDGKRWTANWAFAIDPEAVKREGYEANVFPPDLAYDREYPGCPYCKVKEDLAKLTAPPVRRKLNIAVTSSGCDDIGSILSSMEIPYKSFSSVKFNCDILFINCLTSDSPSPTALRSFVEKGGILYASCYADDLMKKAFPGIFVTDHSGKVHDEEVTVEDEELCGVVGPRIGIRFNTIWAKLYSAKGSTCLLRSTQDRRLPVMVRLNYGKGTIFFTCFHNHAQASQKEQALLQLLILKQLGQGQTLSETGAEYGIDIEAIKAKFRSNW